jgi:hypothetical protein
MQRLLNKLMLDSPEAVAMAYDQAAFSVRSAAAVLNFAVERVQELLHALALSSAAPAAGGSPVLVLKRRHSIRKRSPNKNKQQQQQHMEEPRSRPEASARGGGAPTLPCFLARARMKRPEEP